MEPIDIAPRIAAVSDSTDPLLVHALAARLERLARDIGSRLERIERALRARDALAALRCADEEPVLPAAIRCLEAGSAPAWVARCLACGFEAPSLPLARAKAVLARISARPPHEDEAVPSGFRRAMRLNAPEEALHFLRLWSLMDPSDPDVAAQRTALEAQVAAGWVSQLASAPADDADPALLAKIAALPRPVLESIAGWERVTALLTSQLEKQRDRILDGASSPAEATSLRFSESAARAGEWLLLSTLCPAPDASRAVRGETLLKQAREALEAARETAAASARLDLLRREFPGSAAAYEDSELDRLSAELARLSQRLPETAGAAARALAGETRRIAASRRWSRRRRTAARAGIAAASIGLMAAVGYQVAARIDKSDTPGRAEPPPSENTSVVTTPQPPDAGASQQPLAPAAANPPEVDEFFRRARETEQELTQGATVRGAERVAARIAELSQLAATLPATRQREADARLSVLRASLSSWRSDLQDAARQALSAAEAIRRAEFGAGASPESIRRGLDRLQPLLDSIAEAADSQAVGMPQLMQAQASTLVREVRATAERLDTFERALATWRQAGTEADYRRALAGLAGSGFSEDPRVRFAAALAQGLPATETLVATAFAGADASAWRAAATGDAALFSGGSTASRPLLDLVADPMLRDVHQYVLVSRSEGAVPTPVVIHTAGPMQAEEFAVGNETRTRQSARVLTGEGVVEREFLSRVTADGQRRGESLELGFRTPEAALVEQLAQRVDAAQGVFTQSPLGFLETLVNDELASPVFKAYLLLALAPSLESAPVQTGYAYSPGARELVGAIRQVSGGSIRATSWVEPAFRGLSAQLAREFRNAAPAVFVEEGRVLASLYARLSSERFEFVGQSDADGAPATRASVGVQLWGFTGERLRFERVLRPGQPPAVPLSPLYTFSADTAAIVREQLAAAKLPDAALARLRRQLDAAR